MGYLTISRRADKHRNKDSSWHDKRMSAGYVFEKMRIKKGGSGTKEQDSNNIHRERHYPKDKEIKARCEW
jgi:hypothetical protein